MLHCPVLAVYVEEAPLTVTCGVPSELGRRSWTVTFVAVAGPSLVRVTVNVSLSPTRTVCWSAVFEMRRSAFVGAVAAFQDSHSASNPSG